MGKRPSKNQSIKSAGGQYSKMIVSFVILANVIFTFLVLVTFWRTGSEPSTLIGAWFTFTTVELWNLARIKGKKEETKQKEIEFGNGDDICG